MNKKLSIVALSAIFSVNAFAYDAPEVYKANGSSDSIEEFTIHGQGDEIADKVDLDSNAKLASTYIAAKYMSVNEDFDSTGFEVELGTSIYNVEMTASYRDFETSLDHVATKPMDDIKQARASLLIPLVVADDYAVHAGVSYAYTEAEATQMDNHSVFGTLKVEGQLSDSIVSYGAVDFEFYEDDALLNDGSSYDVHDSATFRFGLDYFATENLAMGTSVSFGSELDSTFALQFSYHI
ncbi:hypothetical protein OTK49_00885 [Vibrio coralliirubri]|uniref:hypothetical protein n=1 Tax=Vibrio coralliirubri TaxID=1516159 RepID=UPI002284A1E6|nr:hypothetical protein [Vibrio coralliirubri]MCY9861086.1 hypothetical protein [Vibrio coralliirubri]